MGYSHGQKWTDDAIKQEVLSIMKALNISRLPTKSECEQVTGNSALTNAITRRFGWYKLAEIMSLDIKKCETTIGKELENVAEIILTNKGFSVEKMTQNHSFDLLVNGSVKIDVKASHLYKGETGDYYTFNLGSKNHSCDFFMLMELENNNDVKRVMIVPAVVVMKIKQISVGAMRSKYHIFTNCYDYILNLSNYWSELRGNKHGKSGLY